jgi:pyruvate/2-oxoglutarate dehydrogenase complex dihydrolipoamide dehydrogenase (E3) component
MAHRFDAIVIGTGQAGPFVASRFARAGMTVAIAERGRFGGTCVNTGCIPTKAMVASAYVAHTARRAAEYGVTVPGAVDVDMPRVKARRDAISESSRSGVEQGLRSTANITVYDGHARFESAKVVSVGNEQLTAERIFINVGGRALVPPLPGIDAVPYLTNSSIMDVDFVPEHLVIVGGSYIGLEFGQMFRRFGSEVTIIEMADRLIRREDPDVSAAVLDVLEREGIHVRLNAKCITLARRDNNIVAGVECTSGAPEVVGTHLLLAVGRQPNTGDLGLDRAGIAVDERGYIVVNDELATNVPGVWALGDCNGRGAFTHTAFNDAEIVVANLLEGDSRRVSDRIQTYGLFIDPPLGRVGMTDAEVRATGRPALVGKRLMKDVKRAVEKGETQGFIKIVVDAETSLIRGAAILGTGGDEVVHSILDVMYARAPYTLIKRAMHIHPTVSELIPTTLWSLKPLE